MTISEFDLIKKYFLSSTTNPDLVSVGIGDDAAVINTRPGEQLVISVDTLNLGVHFPEQSSAFDIGYKALAVNLSDLAAMGAQPMWFTLAVSLPSVDEEWLEQFSLGMLSLAQQYDLCLVGGDTTKGPLSITIQIAGTVPSGKGLTRSGARVGDDIYVTGTLGDAAAALAACENKAKFNADDMGVIMQRLNRPTPRVAVGLALSSIASACIDISDGLAADLGHILEASQAGADIRLNALPLSDSLLQLDVQSRTAFALYGGDDYELCFTAPATASKEVESLQATLDCAITCIGQVISEAGLYQVDNESHINLDIKGFDHFQVS